MLPHNLIVSEAIERQTRDRIQKEAENARRLRKLVLRNTEDKGKRDKKPVIELGWLDQAHA
jgi:hypothetical protein